MTDQEKKFADEFVFRYFNSKDICGTTLAVEAAEYAGYELFEDKIKSEQSVWALYNTPEIKTYIEDQIQDFKSKLHPAQRRTLWTAIASMTVGDPGELLWIWDQYGLIKSNI